MNQAENKSLRQAIDDLNNVNSFGHGKSSKYTRMENSLTALTGVIAKYYPQNGQAGPQGGQAGPQGSRPAGSQPKGSQEVKKGSSFVM